jgi:hypothetical protein
MSHFRRPGNRPWRFTILRCHGMHHFQHAHKNTENFRSLATTCGDFPSRSSVMSEPKIQRLEGLFCSVDTNNGFPVVWNHSPAEQRPEIFGPCANLACPSNSIGKKDGTASPAAGRKQQIWSQLGRIRFVNRVIVILESDVGLKSRGVKSSNYRFASDQIHLIWRWFLLSSSRRAEVTSLPSCPLKFWAILSVNSLSYVAMDWKS